MQKSVTKTMLTMVLMSVFILCMGMTVCAAGGKIAPTQEILTASWNSGMLQVEDKVIQLPVRLSQLLEMGFTYDDFSKNILVQRNAETVITLFYKGKRVASVNVFNETELPYATIEQMDPLIREFIIIGGSEDDIYFPGGIKLGDSSSVIEARLGAPREIDFAGAYVYGTNVNAYGFVDMEVKLGLEFLVDRDSGTIEEMRIRKDANVTTLDQMTPILMTNIENSSYSSDLHNVAFLFMPDYKTAHRVSDYTQAIVQVGTELYGMDFEYDVYLEEYCSGSIHGETVYDQTDANGIRRVACVGRDHYEIACYNGKFVLKGELKFTNLATESTENFDSLFREAAIQVASSMVFS